LLIEIALLLFAGLEHAEHHCNTLPMIAECMFSGDIISIPPLPKTAKEPNGRKGIGIIAPVSFPSMDGIAPAVSSDWRFP
jgi:hypothetical protein